MRWISLFILAYLAVGLQVGVSPFVSYHGAAPNLGLLAVIFIAINAPRDVALIGCFMVGIVQDLVTQQPPGLFALSYGLVALFVTGTQQAVYREHPLTHFSMALAGGMLTMMLLVLHSWLRPAAPRVRTANAILPAIHLSLTTQLTQVLYTALLAPLVLGVLQRFRGTFRFQPAKRRIRAW